MIMSTVYDLLIWAMKLLETKITIDNFTFSYMEITCFVLLISTIIHFYKKMSRD